MVGDVINFDSNAHQSVYSLLPWWINGTLEGEELMAVEQHVRDCPRCQREVVWLRELQLACSEDNVASDALHAFHALQEKLGIGISVSRGETDETAQPVAAGFSLSWLPWAFAMQFAVIIGLGLWILHDRPPVATYHTLGGADSAPHPVDAVVIEFAPQTPLAVLRRILQQTNAQIVAGPTKEGAFVLRLEKSGRDVTLQELRSDPAVVLVESLGVGDTR